MEEYNKELYEKLKKQNEEIRTILNDLIGINNPIYSVMLIHINELINNEIEQEKLCNQ